MQEGLLVIDSYTMILSGNSSAWKIFQVDKPGTGRSVYSLDRNEDFRKVIETVWRENMEVPFFIWIMSLYS